MSKPDFDKVRTAADKLLVQFGIDEPPVDPEMLAEASGIKVRYAEFFGEAAQKYSGFFRPIDNSIIVNKQIPDNRITFTIAHELGHSILHQEYIRSKGYQPMPRSNWFDSNKPIEEVEADHFAANLLVPLYMLKERVSGRSNELLSRIFFVSTDVIANRLNLLARYPALAYRPQPIPA